MQITEAIIHGLEKSAKSHDVAENPRQNPSPLDDQMQGLGQDVLKEYGRRSNSHGTFDPDQATYSFSLRLQEYMNGQINLVQFSQAASRLIAAEMKKSYLATGGYAFFIRYNNQGQDWLLILMLKLKAGTSIDPQKLELLKSLSFDINHLHEAARIDFGKWQSGEQPYLSFIKKSGGQDDITRYFRLALGCTEYTDSKYNTEQVISAVDKYCADRNLGDDAKREARKKLYDYFEEKNNSDDKSVSLKALSARLDDINPDDFYDYVKDENIPVNDVFSPAKRVYGRLQRIQRKFGGVSVSFEVEDLINDIVDYDEQDEVLYIRDVPQSLINDIRRAKGQ